MGLEEAIRIDGTGFGMAFLEMAEDLHPLDLMADGCGVLVKLEQGAIGGPVIAEIHADLSLGYMGIWSFDMTPEEVADVWPADEVFVVAEYNAPTSVSIRQPKAIIYQQNRGT